MNTEFEDKKDRSEYLCSLYNPQMFPYGPPDSNIRANVFRQETVTDNIVVGTEGSGLFLFYPNHPGTLLGYHYIWDGAKHVYDKTITYAQDLTTAYDYGRKTAQLITLKSSTLPAGAYALNGTINAVTYQGRVSEIPNLNYNKVLSASQSALDKVGNILIGTGVGMVMMPQELGTGYIRLGDSSPSVVSTGGGSLNCRMADADESLNYMINSTNDSAGFTSTAQVLHTFTFNVDSSGPVVLTGSMRFNWGSATVTAGAGNLVALKATVDYLDFTGALIFTTYMADYQFDISSTRNAVEATMFGIPTAYMTDNPYHGSHAPIASATVTYSVNAANGQTIAWTTAQISSEICVKVPAGNHTGVDSPVTIVVYDGVTPASILTLAGLANFQLVPNPELLKNVTLVSVPTDKDEEYWVKRVLQSRVEIGLPTVFSLNALGSVRQRMDGAASYYDETIASSMSFGKIWRGIRKAAPFMLPAAKIGLRLASKAGGRVGTAAGISSGILDVATGSSASGIPIMRSLSATQSHSEAMEIYKGSKRKYNDYVSDSSEKAYPEHFSVFSGESDGGYKSLAELGGVGVLFPTITLSISSGQLVGQKAFLAVRGYHPLTTAIKQNSTSTISGHLIHGLSLPVSSKLILDSDVTLIPISEVRSEGVIVDVTGPVVTGRSHEASVSLLQVWQDGIYPYLLTGAVSSRKHRKGFTLSIKENDAFPIKSLLAERLGVPLVGNHPQSDPVVTSVAQAQQLGISKDPTHLRSKYVSCDPGFECIAISMDGGSESEEDSDASSSGDSNVSATNYNSVVRKQIRALNKARGLNSRGKQRGTVRTQPKGTVVGADEPFMFSAGPSATLVSFQNKGWGVGELLAGSLDMRQQGASNSEVFDMLMAALEGVCRHEAFAGLIRPEQMANSFSLAQRPERPEGGAINNFFQALASKGADHISLPKVRSAGNKESKKVVSFRSMFEARAGKPGNLNPLGVRFQALGITSDDVSDIGYVMPQGVESLMMKSTAPKSVLLEYWKSPKKLTKEVFDKLILVYIKDLTFEKGKQALINTDKETASMSVPEMTTAIERYNTRRRADPEFVLTAKNLPAIVDGLGVILTSKTGKRKAPQVSGAPQTKKYATNRSYFG